MAVRVTPYRKQLSHISGNRTLLRAMAAVSGLYLLPGGGSTPIG